jgi:hypothetical protein
VGKYVGVLNSGLGTKRVFKLEQDGEIIIIKEVRPFHKRKQITE